MRTRTRSLARQLLLLQVAGFGVLVAVGAVLAYLSAVQSAERRAGDEVTAVAQALADTPVLLSALSTADPSVQLQPFAERVRADTGVDFITIMSPDGIRFTHPNPALIGGRYLGTISEAQRGRTYVETYTGTLGPSKRAIVPVFDTSGQVVALVSVGIKTEVIWADVTSEVALAVLAAIVVLAVGVAGSFLLSRRLERQTRGLGAAELGSVFAYYEAALHAVREGLVLVGADRKVVLCNDGARELLDLADDPAGKPVTALNLPPLLESAFHAQEPHSDEIHLTDSRALVVSTAPVRSGEHSPGTVITLRDHTDLLHLTGELNSTRGLAEALRAQAHEAANRLHTVVSLVELGRTEEAVEFATAELAVAQRLTDQVVGAISEPVLSALLLGKAAEANERGVELVVTEDTALGELDLTWIAPRDLVTIVGNLIDNALEAVVASPGTPRPRVAVTSTVDGEELIIQVADNGPGVSDTAVPEMFGRGWSTKAGKGPLGRGLGLALVGQAVRRYSGTIALSNDQGATFTVRLPMPGRDCG